MIRQAHTYLAGAVSGTALVAAAIVAFVLLVSFQALRDWPLADLSIGGGDDAAISPTHAGGGPAVRASSATSAGATAARAGSRPGATADRRSSATPSTEAAVDASPSPSTSSPAAGAPAPTAQGAPGAPDPSGSSSSATGGGGNGGGGDGGSLPGLGGSGGGGSPSTSEAVTGTVNKTVSGVDEATGGALGDTGVTKVSEEVVSGVAGPESVVGKTVDETVKTVGGLLGGNR